MPFDESRLPGPRRGAGERAINLPPVLLWLIGINVAVQILRELLPESLDLDIIQQFGVVPAVYTSGAGPDVLSLLLAPITYQFLHGGWMHLGINMVTLAAFGVPVVRVLGARRFLLFYLSAGIVAGFVHVFFFPDSTDPVVGASGAISGVFGAVLMLMRSVGSLPSLLPIAGVWIALNVFFGIYGGTPGAGGDPVAWTAHIGGFVYGLAVIRLFMPRPTSS
ncbi:MAG: rhomboid family intramembrane serine protease [Reyranella sp.]|nr:rhomboid family intramembrane serine protease [Reyranella sp.]